MVNEVGVPGNQTAEIRVLTETAGGDPVRDQQVRLIDESGGSGVPIGRTDVDGLVVFHESVGPPPCNRLVAEVVETGERKVAGCFNGGEMASLTFTVPDPPESEPGAMVLDRRAKIVLATGGGAAVGLMVGAYA